MSCAMIELKLLLGPGKAHKAPFLGVQSSLLPFLGAVYLYTFDKAYFRHVQVFCQNVRRAHWPTPWKPLLQRLEWCTSSLASTGAVVSDGLSWLTGDGSFEWVMVLRTHRAWGYSGKWFISKDAHSELLSGGRLPLLDYTTAVLNSATKPVHNRQVQECQQDPAR